MAKNTRTGGRDATTAVIPGAFGLSVGHPGTPPPAGFAWRALSDLARLESGHTPSRGKPEYWDGGVPWIGIRDASGNHGKVLHDTEQHVTQLGLDNSSARLLPAGTVCLSRTASVGFVVTMGQPMATSQDFVNWVCGPELDHRYLHYLLMAEQDTVRRIAYGSVHPTMYYPDAKALHVCVPSLHDQQAVADVLSALDNKIAGNAATLGLLSELADAHFAGALAGASRVVDLGDVAEFHNRRRVPLSSREREVRPGRVPYYGAAGRLDFVDEALFDEPLLLVGEDGTVVRDDGGPVTQYIWGPAWVNNHAHVLTGRGISTELLRIAVRRSSVAHLVTGAVQPKLSMGNLRKLELSLPMSPEQVERRVQSLAGVEQALVEESRRLETTRDELLPVLMSGKVRVKDAEKSVEGVL